MLDEGQITNILNTELQAATGKYNSDAIRSNQRDAWDAYLGGGMPRARPGRSNITSTDVADTIETLVPHIMSALTRNNEIVTFDAAGDGDEVQARLESEYVHRTVMCDNDGYNWVQTLARDAALMKNGIPKVYYERTTVRHPMTYTGLTVDVRDQILSAENTELVEMTESIDAEKTQAQQMQWEQQVQMIRQSQMAAVVAGQPAPPIPPPPPPIMIYDLRVEEVEERNRVKIEAVEPEHFCINTMHDDQSPSSARFCAQVSMKAVSDLVEMGFEREQVEGLARNTSNDEHNRFRWWATGERTHTTGLSTDDKSQQEIEFCECYIRMDKDEDGIAELYQVFAVGNYSASEILRWELPDHIDPNEETVDERYERLAVTEMDEADHPFPSSVACIQQPHKFYGTSIYDRVIDLMRLKTALWRNTLDNLYLLNNQQKAIKRGSVNLDDMLVSRVGGFWRCDDPHADIREIVTQPIGDSAMKMLDYADSVVSKRIGVSPGQQMTADIIGSAIGSEGVAQIMSANELVQGMIIRQVAEGLKPVYMQVRNLLRKYQDIPTDFQFRGEWQQVNPRQWRRSRTATIRVGTGSGSTREQQAAMAQLVSLQERIFQTPGQVLVDQANIYNSCATIAKLAGITNVEAYFNDPTTPDGEAKTKAAQESQAQEKAKQDELDAALADAQQRIADAEMGKVQVAAQKNSIQAENDRLKLQLQQAESGGKMMAEGEKAAAKESELAVKYAELEFKYAELRSKEAIELTKKEADMIMAGTPEDMSAEHEQNKAVIDG